MQSATGKIGIHSGTSAGDLADVPDARGGAARAEVEARIPEFSDLTAPPAPAGNGSLDQLLDVTCTVTAELGRRTLSIGDVLKLNIGAVLELDRLVSEPVDVLVQGVRLARGEVVVVNDHFAIRIKEVIDSKRK